MSTVIEAPRLTPRIEEIEAYMVERLNILLKKNAGEPKPWTEDKILQEYRFCNVFREDDTVTIWIDENIRKPYADHPDLWLMLSIGRMINWPDTLQELIDSPYWFGKSGFSLQGMADVMQARADRKEKVYTGAYMIRAEITAGASKHEYICNKVIGLLVQNRKEFEDLFDKPNLTLKEVWELYQDKRFIGWGPFMTYEVVTDMRHTRYLRNAPDIMTWANAGPGAMRGLNRMYGRPLDDRNLGEETYTKEIERLMTELNSRGRLPQLEMRDVEHNLCEHDKRKRVQNQEGRPRSKYDGIGSTTHSLV